MKKNLLLILLMVAFASFVSAQDVFFTDFEFGDKDGWSGYNNALKNVNDQADPSVYPAEIGTYFIRIGGIDSGHNRILAAGDLEAGKTYTLEFDGRCHQHMAAWNYFYDGSFTVQWWDGVTVNDKGKNVYTKMYASTNGHTVSPGDNDNFHPDWDAYYGPAFEMEHIVNTFTVPDPLPGNVAEWRITFWSPAKSWAFDIDNIHLYESPATAIETVNASNFTLSPNPTNGIVNVKGTDVIAKYTVYNTTGLTVVEKMVNANNVTIDLNGFAKGIYLVSLTNENGKSEIKKVLVK